MVFGAIKAIWNITNLTFVGRIFGVLKLFLKFSKEIVSGVVKFFVKNFDDIAKKIGKAIGGAWSGMKKIFTDAGRWLTQQLFNWGLKFFEWSTKCKTAANKAWSAIKSVFSGAKEWFARSVITPIVNKFNNIKTAFRSGFASGIKSILNTWISGLNSPINALKSFKVAGKQPFAFLPTFHRLAKGGIATSPTFAMIGEGREDEAVAPLSKLQGMITTAVVSAMGGRGGDVILNIDGRRFARLVKPHLERENKRVGTNVRLNPI
jgi:hypothetical protein